MIKIIVNSLTLRNILQPKLAMAFCKQLPKKTQDITAMFTDRAFEAQKQKPITAGRSWKAAELRIKSTQDLHKLWYVCVRQKNLVLADELANEFDNTYSRKGGRIRRHEKLQLTMRRILFIINERQQIKKQYKRQLEDEYIEKKKNELKQAVSQAAQPIPEITHQMLRAKYHELRKGIDNTNYLESLFDKKDEVSQRNKRAEDRVAKLNPEEEFQSFWKYEMTIGERPTQNQILKSHVKNWKSLNLKQRKIILGFLNARRSKAAKSEFKKELRILGQKIAFEEAKDRSTEMHANK